MVLVLQWSCISTSSSSSNRSSSSCCSCVYYFLKGIRPTPPPELNINSNSSVSNSDASTPARLLFKQRGLVTTTPKSAQKGPGTGTSPFGKAKPFTKPRISTPADYNNNNNNNNHNNHITDQSNAYGTTTPTTPLSAQHPAKRFKSSTPVFNLKDPSISHKFSLKQFAAQNPPRSYTATELSLLGIRPEVIDMTSESAKTFVFRQPYNFPVDSDLIPITPSPSQTEAGEIGIDEMMTALLVSKYSIITATAPIFYL